MGTTAAFIIGFLTNFATAFVFEKFRKPNLRILVGKKTPPATREDIPGLKWSFLHANVTNQDRFGLTQPALSCRDRISFVNPETKARIFPTFFGRWSGSPQPYIPETRNGTWGRADPNQFPLVRKMDILPDETEELDIAIKFDGEPEFYAFSNESFLLHQRIWTNLSWKVDLKEVLVEVVVFSGTTTAKKVFRIENPSFEVEKIELRDLENSS